MVDKKIIIIIFFIFLNFNSYSKILHENRDFVITDIDLEIYKKIHLDNYNTNLNSNRALKELILIKSVIKNLEENNNEFLKKIDEELLIEFGDKYIDDDNVKEFLRFNKIRNEFIINYFKNELDISELESLFKNLDSLKLPISKNECLIIDDVLNLQNDKNFIISFYNKLKNNSQEIFILNDNTKYQVCIDKSTFKSIEGLIVNYIRNQTNKEFEKFIYDKVTN